MPKNYYIVDLFHSKQKKGITFVLSCKILIKGDRIMHLLIHAIKSEVQNIPCVSPDDQDK